MMSAGMVYGCQEVKEPTTTLTQAQWEEVKQHILEAPPENMRFTSKANFGGSIDMLGLDVSPAKPKPGQEVTLTWYWRCTQEMSVNWQVFVHFDNGGPPAMRQGMDHHPVRDLYQTTRWKKGQIIKDIQKVRVRADYPGGKGEFWVGLWNPAKGSRMELTNPGDVKHDGQNRVLIGTVDLNAPPPKSAKPSKKTRVYMARHTDGAPITIDGKLTDEVWTKAARTNRFGGTSGGSGPEGTNWAKILYDDTHLYIAMYGDDADVWGDLTERDSDTWTQEVFEIFIDPEGDQKDYLELQITPRNTVFDARFPVKLGKGTGSREEQINTARAWNSAMETAVFIDGTLNDPSDTDLSWSVEVKIPFSDIPGPSPKPGTSWKINLYRFDAPRKDGKPQRQIA
ncbi:MAG: carbohydrate-binding family 9-like protein, partial [Myxococcota bacterium]